MVVCKHDLAQRKKLIAAILSSLGLEGSNWSSNIDTECKIADKNSRASEEFDTPKIAKDIKLDMSDSNSSLLTCPNCRKTFKLKRNLDKHVKEKHEDGNSVAPNRRDSNRKSASNAEKKSVLNKSKSPVKLPKMSKEHEKMNAEFEEIDDFQLKLSTQQAFGNVSTTPKRAFLDDSSSDESCSPTIERKSVADNPRRSTRKPDKEKVPENVQSKLTTVRFSDDIDKDIEGISRRSCPPDEPAKLGKNNDENLDETIVQNESKKRRSDVGSNENVGGRNRRSSGNEEDESFVSAVTNNLESTGVEDVSAASVTPVVINEDTHVIDVCEISSMFRQHFDELKEEFNVLFNSLRNEMMTKLEKQESTVSKKDQGTSVDLKSKNFGIDKATSIEVAQKSVKVQVAMVELLEDKSTETEATKLCSLSAQTEMKSSFEVKDAATSCEGLLCYDKPKTPESCRRKSKKSGIVDCHEQQSTAESVEKVDLNDSFLFETQSKNNTASQKTCSKTPPSKRSKTPKTNGHISVSGDNTPQADAIFDAPLNQNGEPIISFLQTANSQREENVVLSCADEEAQLQNEVQKENAQEINGGNVGGPENEELTDSILMWSMNLTEDESQKSKKDTSLKKTKEASNSSLKRENSGSLKRKMSTEKLHPNTDEDFVTSTQHEVVFQDGQTLHKKKKMEKFAENVELYEALATPSTSNIDGVEQRSGLIERNQTPFVKKSVSGCQSDASDSSVKKRKGQNNKYSSSLVFVGSGLNAKENITVKKLCSKLGATFSKSFDKNTTHLIMKSVPEYPDKFIFPRTIKFLEAVSMGLWIVEYQWVLKCLNKDEKVPELPYEMRGDLFCGLEHRGPAKARERALTNEKLFRGFVFFCPAESTDIPLEMMQKLITNSGGSYITHREDFVEVERGKKVIIAETEDQQFSVVVMKMADECGAPVISREWFVDSLTVSELQPTENFAQYQPSNGEIEY